MSPMEQDRVHYVGGSEKVPLVARQASSIIALPEPRGVCYIYLEVGGTGRVLCAWTDEVDDEAGEVCNSGKRGRNEGRVLEIEGRRS